MKKLLMKLHERRSPLVNGVPRGIAQEGDLSTEPAVAVDEKVKDPKEEMRRLTKAIKNFAAGDPPANDIAVSTFQARYAMQLYNLAFTLSRKLKGDPEAEKAVSLARWELPKYWEGKIPYSRRMKFTPAQRASL